MIILKKFTSRKFIAMIAGLLTGIGLLLSGETTEGVIAVLVSVGAYMTAEGIIDMKGIKEAAEFSVAVKEVSSEIAKKSGDRNDIML